MKRQLDRADELTLDDDKMKKVKILQEEEEKETGFANLDADLLFEVLKHVDSKSLAKAACVNNQWHKTAQDERLWEMICTRHWSKNGGSGNQQLRSVVLALGGFRRLHSLCLWPLLKPPPSSSSSSSSASGSVTPTPSLSVVPPISSKGKMPTNWGKDEVHLSLSLLSIRYYEKMNFKNKRQ